MVEPLYLLTVLSRRRWIASFVFVAAIAVHTLILVCREDVHIAEALLEVTPHSDSVGALHDLGVVDRTDGAFLEQIAKELPFRIRAREVVQEDITDPTGGAKAPEATLPDGPPGDR